MDVGLGRLAGQTQTTRLLLPRHHWGAGDSLNDEHNSWDSVIAKG